MHDALRLPLTLIPSSMAAVNVRTALPQHWDRIRHQVYAPHRCEACGGDNRGHPWEAHEYWGYEGGRQVLRHIACLCDMCHASTHLGRTRTVSGSEQAARDALAHLAHVNGWSPPNAAEYARRELALCKERSRRQWRLDLSLLEREFGIKVPPELGGPAQSGLLRRLLGAT
jgi:hypothetical protein